MGWSVQAMALACAGSATVRKNSLDQHVSVMRGTASTQTPAQFALAGGPVDVVANVGVMWSQCLNCLTGENSVGAHQTTSRVEILPTLLYVCVMASILDWFK